MDYEKKLEKTTKDYIKRCQHGNKRRCDDCRNVFYYRELFYYIVLKSGGEYGIIYNCFKCNKHVEDVKRFKETEDIKDIIELEEGYNCIDCGINVGYDRDQCFDCMVKDA